MGSTQPKSDAYVLNRNHAAASRLNYQHYLWKETVGYTLHPDIPKPKADAKIADVATGTGIWMIDVARDMPESVQFEGSDIDISQCPPQGFLPSNIKTYQWDMFGDVPEELIGRYDLVHLSLIGVVIKDDNAVPAINNLCKLLKPGGWLQWQEMDDDGSFVATADPSVKKDAMEKLRSYMHSPKDGVKGNHTWRRELPATLKANGFAEAALHRYETAPAFTRFWNDNYMTVVEEFTSKALKDPTRREEAYNLLNAAVEEAQSGACIVIPQLVAIAKKAS